MSKRTWVLIGIVAGIGLMAIVFSAGAIVGNLFLPQPEMDWLYRPLEGSPAADLAETPDSSTSNRIPRNELFQPFWEAWDIVHEQFIDQPVDDVTLMRGAISGMLDSLGDEQTEYLDPDQYYLSNIGLEGEYEGIGAWVDTTAEYLTIISPMPGSPAKEAGLRPGDEVIKIDGEDMTGLDGSVVILKVLGPAGTEVVLTIRREGVAEPFDVTIIRAKISPPSVESKMIDNNLGYVQIYTFGRNTTDQLRDNLRTLLKQNPDGLIVDFRNNGGGYLDKAVEVASEFIDNNVVLYEDFGSDQQLKEFRTIPGGLATEIPLVLLVNEGSASASEIVVGAVQDHERGLVVGATTFGKGSVQNWIPLRNDQGAVRITTARWLTPDKRQINDIGLEPDYVVEFTEEDFENELDPQLDKAVEVLLDLIGG